MRKDRVSMRKDTVYMRKDRVSMRKDRVSMRKDMRKDTIHMRSDSSVPTGSRVSRFPRVPESLGSHGFQSLSVSADSEDSCASSKTRKISKSP